MIFFEDNNVNVLFKSFLNTYLRLFYASFPLIFHRKNNNNSTLLITPTIKMQCNLKRALYLLSQKYNNSKIKNYYKALCKSLSKNVLEAKRSYYNNLLSTSNNKISGTWKITITITGRTDFNDGITTVCVNGNLTDNPQFISESFNSYFLSIADKIANKVQSTWDSLTVTFLPSHIYQVLSKNRFHRLNLTMQVDMKLKKLLNP
jgi:hypothetical protein